MEDLDMTLEEMEAAMATDESVWLDMWHTTAAKQGCLDPNTCTVWADHGLAAFQQRFRSVKYDA